MISSEEAMMSLSIIDMLSESFNEDEEDKCIVIYFLNCSSSYDKSEINNDDKIKFVNFKDCFNLRYIAL